MSLVGLMPNRLQVVRRTGTDDDRQRHYTWSDHGNPLPARVVPGSTFEAQGQQTGSPRDTLVESLTAYLAGWPDVLPTDRVRDERGRIFDIDGQPETEQNPNGVLKLTTLRLRLATDL